MNENAFWNLSYGIYVVSAWDGERATGCIVNSAMQITAVPPTIAISVNHDNFTHECIEKTNKFAISILGESTSPALIGAFGYKSGKNLNKFDSVKHSIKFDMPIIDDSCAFIICEVIDKMQTDTHTVFLGKVTEADVLITDTPMTYDYFHKVIKGKSPKNAPTYIPNKKKEEVKTEKYVCSVCGYEYTGDVPFEELPDSYQCPICEQPKSVFKKVETN